MKIEVNGANAHVAERALLTSGAVGLTCEFAFDRSWDGLIKTAVFRAGSVTRDVVDMEASVTVPHEVLETAGQKLLVGVYGVNEAGDVVIPTVWADMGLILSGADPSGDPGTDPTLPVWAQVKIDTVQTVPQALAEEQQAQARDNISAASKEELAEIQEDVSEVKDRADEFSGITLEQAASSKKYLNVPYEVHTGTAIAGVVNATNFVVTREVSANSIYLNNKELFVPTHKSVHCYLTDNSLTLEQDKTYLITGEDVSLKITHADTGDVLSIGSTTGLMCICGQVGDTNDRLAYGKFLYVTKTLGISSISSKTQPIYGDAWDATGIVVNKYTATVSWKGAADVIEL